MVKIYKFNENNIDLANIRKLRDFGHQILCDKCDSQLIIALSLEEANKLGVVPGIYCPQDGKHIYIHLYTREAHNKMHELFKKIDKDKKENKENKE